MAKGHNTNDPFLVKQINEMLFDRYGRSIDGRPIWRVVWSDDELEIRVGEHNEYSSSGAIWLNKWIGAKRVKKYNYIPEPRWVLERLTFLPLNNRIVLEELPEARGGTYEPIYFFQDQNFNALPVTWLAVEYALKVLQDGVDYGKNPKAREEMREKFEDMETEYMAEALGEAGRSNLFAFENSVFHDSTKQAYLGSVKDQTKSIIIAEK